MFLSSFYKKCPTRIQEMLISSRARVRSVLREGRAFDRLVHEINETQWYTQQQIAEYHEFQLYGLLRQCSENVPFYYGVAKALEGASSAAEFLKFMPLLDKMTVRAAGKQLLSNNASRFIFKTNTSGTSGTPLTLFQDLHAINRENAFVWRQLEWAGYTSGAKRAWIRGDMIIPASVVKPPFWRKNDFDNMLMFSSYHLSEQNSPAYLAALAQFDPAIIQAYPSSIAFLAAYLDAADQFYAGENLRGVVTSSETLTAIQRELIEKRFGCRVFDWYGQTEHVAAIGTCEQGRYHIISDYSYVELIPSEAGRYELVGTGLSNFVMPLIRYRTGDFVESDAVEQCTCGRSFPVVKRIHGRDDDYVKLRDGRRIGRMDHVFKDVENILEAQIVQDTLDELVIRVVPSPKFGGSEEKILLKNASDRVGDGILIRIERTDSLERTRSGKLRNVICNVK